MDSYKIYVYQTKHVLDNGNIFQPYNTTYD